MMVSVIIPCRNERKHIEGFLDSLRQQENGGWEVEVLIADGMSDDGTRDILAKETKAHPNFRIIDNPARFVSTGLNAAIRAAKGEIIIRMDVHSHYGPRYIEKCIETLKKTRAANVGGPARTRSDTYMQKANSLAYHSSFSSGGAAFHNPDYEGYVDTVTYGCWKKSTLEKIGGFDEELVRNQDDELNLRLVRSGEKIWQNPEIESWYYPRASLRAVYRQYSQYGYWKVRVIQKHRIPSSIRHLVPALFVGSLMMAGLLAIFFPWARWVTGGLGLVYLMANLCATLVTCRSVANWKYLPAMPFLFAAYHFGYGYGFLRGLIAFGLLRRGGGSGFSQLTRGTEGLPPG